MRWLFLCLVVCWCGSAMAQMATTTQGTEFYVSFMPNNTTPTLKLLISAKRACTGSIAGTGYNQNFSVAAGGTTLITVNNSAAYTSTAGSVAAKALKVTSSDTISLYASNWVQNSSDANNVLPTAALGSKYMAMSYTGISNMSGQKSTVLIVATEDGTRVNITPRTYRDSTYTKTVSSGNGTAKTYQTIHKVYGAILVDSTISNKNLKMVYHIPTYGTVVRTPVMSAGQTYLYTSDNDLSGTIIDAENCKKIAVFTGHQRTSVGSPLSTSYSSDHLVEQMLPLNSLGRKFVLVPTMDRIKDRYRILAAESGTTVTIDGVSRKLGKGLFYEGDLRSATYIESDKPLAVCIYPISMGAPEGNKNNSNLGDNSMIWVNPVEQNLEDIIFSALPTSLVKNHYINVVVNTADVALTTLDNINIAGNFTKVAAKPEYSYARIGGISDNISHRLKNPKGVSAYVYGYGNAEAYGYTAGSSVKDLTLGVIALGTKKEGQNMTFSLSGINEKIEIVSWQFGNEQPIMNTSSTLPQTFSMAGCRDVRVVYSFFNGCTTEEKTALFPGAACIKPADINIQGALEVCEGDTVVNLSLFNGGANGLGELRWYKDTVTEEYRTISPLSPFDVPGQHTYYVTQVRNGVESDRVPVMVKIKPRPTLSIIKDTTICKGMVLTMNAVSNGSVTWSEGSQTWATAGVTVSPAATTTYTVTAVNPANGCYVKQPVTVTIAVKPLPTLTIMKDTAICAGQSVSLAASSNGQLTWSAQSPVMPLSKTSYTATAVLNGCTVAKNITVDVTQLPVLTVMNDTTICAGQSVSLNGNSDKPIIWSSGAALVNPQVATTYTATATNGACSVAKDVKVTVNPLPVLTVMNDTTICAGQSVSLRAATNGTLSWSTPITVSPLLNSTHQVTAALNGCLVSKEVAIFVNQPTIGTLVQTACDSAVVNGVLYKQTGVYTQHLVNAKGCDSTLTINLTVNKSTAVTLPLTVCDAAVINGQTYTASGLYVQHLTNAKGCDSTLTINLTVNKSTSGALIHTACDSAVVNGVRYVASGIYTQQLINAKGCDSTLTITLTVSKSTKGALTQVVCDSTVINSVRYTASGVYTQHLVNAKGCDSTLTINLTVNKSTTGTLTQTVCDAATINGQAYTASGIYVQHLTNGKGCDSTLTINLTVNKSTTGMLTQTVCDAATINGQTYATSGTYIQHLTNTKGCDSTLTINLTVNKSTAGALTQTVCDAVTINGQTYTTSGTYVQQLTNARGCDSTLTINLTVNKSTTGTLTQTVCDAATINGQVYTTSGTYIQQLTNTKGCDSTLTINLTVNKLTTGTLTQMVCDAATINGQTYATSGTYVQRLTNTKGCDSTLTINLTVNKSTAGALTQTVCDAVTINGQTYTTSGTYVQQLTNARGCDSTLTINLTVNKSTAGALTQTVCDAVTINGQVYTTSGTYVQRLTNTKGCDSTLTINLTVNKSTTGTLTQTVCDAVTINGQTYTTSGTYVQRLTNTKGCDSTLTINLTVNKSTAGALTQTVCDAATINGQVYTASGTYVQRLTSTKGCDSTLTINLTVNKSTAGALTQTVCDAVTINGQTYTTSGTYVQHLTSTKGCDSTLTINLTVNKPSSGSIALSAYNVATINGQTYRLSGTYVQHLTNAKGCDSTLAIYLTISKFDQAISAIPNVIKAFGDGAFTLSAEASSGLPVTFSVPAGNGVVNINSGEATIIGVGVITVVATQGGGEEYNAAPQQTFTITVEKAAQIIDTIADVMCTYNAPSFVLPSLVTDKGLQVLYSVPANNVISIDAGNRVTILNAGQVTVTAYNAGTANYKDVARSFNIRVNKASQQILVTENIAREYGAAPFTISATASSNLAVTYALPASWSDCISLSDDGRVVITGVGVAVVTIAQSGNENYLPAENKTVTIVIHKAAQVISVANVVKIYGDSAFYLTATATSNMPVRFTAPGSNGIANVAEGRVEIVGVGTLQVVASQVGSSLYRDTIATFTITVNRTPQAITTPGFIFKTYGDQDFSVTSTTSSGLPLKYKLISGYDVISLNADSAKILNAGQAQVEVLQPGNAFYDSVRATISVEVERKSQIIEAIPDMRKYFDMQYFTLNGLSNSGLPVSFEVPENNGVIRLEGNMANIVGVGKVTANAVQSGSRNYMPDLYRFQIEVVDVPPQIIIQPLPHSGTVGDGYCFTAVASGTNLQYQWYYNGEPIPGATDKEYCIYNFEKQNSGAYFVMVSNSADADTSKQAALSIYDVAETLDMTKVYPNPTRGITTIENENLVMEEITLRDGSGNSVYGSYVNGSVAQFDVTNAPSGFYFLIIKTDKGTVVKRVMKVR